MDVFRAYVGAKRTDNRRRKTWARQYIDSLIQRDIKDIASLDKLDHIPRLLNPRLLKTPKLQFLGSGLLSVLIDFSDPMRQRKLFGQLLESFGFAELRKQAIWAEGEYGIFYYRDKDQNEVDFVIENVPGVSVNDLVGLKKLASFAIGPDQWPPALCHTPPNPRCQPAKGGATLCW